jgi:hypothetical protein
MGPWPMLSGQVGQLFVGPYVPFCQIQYTWYPWYSSSSVAPEYLASEHGSYQPDLPTSVKLPSATSELE